MHIYMFTKFSKEDLFLLGILLLIYIGLSTFIIWGDKVQHIYIMIKTAWSFA